jgi:hypothetical protein
MTGRITEIFGGMSQRLTMGEQVAAYRDYTQAEVFFHLAREKAQRIESLRRRFAGRRITRLFVGNNLVPAGLQLPGVETIPLEKNHFERAMKGELQDMVAHMAGALVLINNNDLAVGESAPGYVRVFGQSPDTIFLGWDYDNHHWMESSLALAAHTDLYFPAHNENMYLLSKINALTAGPIPCATVQWTPGFLADNLGEMLRRPRSDEPLGMHFFYQQFGFRNQTVVTLNQKYKQIGFAERSFQAKSPADRLAEWMDHKAHWIIPVLNDVPIRIFDALSSGGIPIVPESLRFLAPVSSLPRDSVVFYGPDDIFNPQAVVARALKLFDEGGQAGIAARHRHALMHHHGADRLARMVAMAQERLEFAPLIG